MNQYHNVIREGDALDVLTSLPDALVQCCITSPPYFGLRDYGVEGQIGREETPEEYISKLVEVFREIRRVLRDEGTCWINIGDSYAGGTIGRMDSYLGREIDGRRVTMKQRDKPCSRKVPNGIKPKDLIGIPWMLAFALRADGWILRSEIIWHKPNCMPESVTDRPTKSHEYLFLLAKNERYYYDREAIAEPATNYIPHTVRRERNIGGRTDGFTRPFGNVATPEAGRNKRSVWTIPTTPYSAAHFATFPPKLIEPCILAGSSPRACEQCGAGWERGSIPTGHVNKREPAHVPANCATKTDSTGWAPTRMPTNEWQPTCHCLNSGTDKCIILDPFMGAGTTALVALQHGRHYLGIELCPAYIQLATRRIETVQPHLWTSQGVA